MTDSPNHQGPRNLDPPDLATLAGRVRYARERLGIAQAELARRVGVRQQTINNLEKPDGPRTTRNPLLLAKVLGVDPGWLTEGTGAAPDGAQAARAALNSTQPNVTVPDRVSMPRDLPVYGTAAGAVSGAFILDMGDVVDYVRRPPALAGIDKAYAIYVEGDSMWPEHKPGDLRIVHPGRKPQPGDDVIVITQNHEHDRPQAYIKRLVRRTADKVVVRQLNPAFEHAFQREFVVALHRVLTMNELFGV